MRYNWDNRVKLDYQDMWLSSYAVLDRLARQDWRGKVRRDIEVFSGDTSLKLNRFQDFRVEVAVQALWQTARLFGNIDGPNFRRLFAGISMDGAVVGILQYEAAQGVAQPLSGAVANETVSASKNGTASHQVLNIGVPDNASEAPVNDFWPDEGEVISNEDEHLTIFYGFNGQQAGRQVLVSMMDALASAAPNGLFSAFRVALCIREHVWED